MGVVVIKTFSCRHWPLAFGLWSLVLIVYLRELLGRDGQALVNDSRSKKLQVGKGGLPPLRINLILLELLHLESDSS
jgi:hypothetical protein